MRFVKTLVMFAALVSFGAGLASAKSPVNYSGGYGLKTAEASGQLKLARMSGDMYQFSVIVYKKDGTTCSIEGMVDLPEGVGIYRDKVQKCDFSLYFDKNKAMIDSAKTCAQCGGKATIDGAYVKGQK